jgi:hypothetical protein
VVNDQLTVVSGLPAASRTAAGPPVSVAVYSVPGVSVAAGVSRPTRAHASSPRPGSRRQPAPC